MSEVKNIFGVNDTDDSLKGKSGSLKFGLNHGNITKFEFNDKAGKDGADADAVDIWVQIGEREQRMRLYHDTGALFNNKNVKINPGEEGYEDLYFNSMGQKIAVIKHALKAVGVTDETIQKVSATLDPTKIVDGIKALVALVPAEFQKRPVDIFLEYQWEIAEDQDKTFPTLPKNMKGGRFLSPAVTPVGKWAEQHEWKDADGEEVSGLRYVDNAGNVHPFDRNDDFMKSKKGTQQDSNSNAASNAMNASAESAQKSTW